MQPGRLYTKQLATATLLILMGGWNCCAQTESAPAQKQVISYGIDFFAGKNAQTAYDMVNLLPGFTFSAGDPTIRGYAAAAGNVVIDGERVSDKQFTLDTVLQHIPADQVDHIDVIETGTPGLEMLGQTVVANVIRKKAAGDRAVVMLSNAVFSNGRNTPGGSVELTRHWTGGRIFSGAVSGSQYVELAEGDGPETLTDGSGNLIGRTAVTSSAGGLNAYTYGTFSTPARKGILSVNGSISRTDYTYHEEDNTFFPAPAQSHLYEHLGGPLGGQLQSEFGGHFSRSLGEKWTSETSALADVMGQSYSSAVQAAGAGQAFFEREHVGETLARSNLRYVAHPGLTAEFSLEGAFNWLRTTSSYTYDAFPVPLPNAVARVSEWRDQLSGNVIWQSRKSMQLELGGAVEDSGITANADQHQAKNLNYLKPRVVLTLDPNPVSHLRFRAEHEVSQLDFTDFVASSSLDTGSVRSGNTSIVPQQDWVLEALYERRFWSEGDLVLTYRHFFLADVIDRVPIESASDPSSVFDAPGNIGSGTEDALSASLTVPLDRFGARSAQLRLTAVQQWSAVTDPTTGEIRPISGLNPLEYSATLHQDLPRWHANWGGTFLTPCTKSSTVKGCTETQYRFDEIDVYRATPAINLFAEFRPWKGMLMHFEGDNLLSQHYDRTVISYSGPRNIYPASSIDSRHLRSFSSVFFSLRKDF
jgi:hypothetical protein